MPYVDSREVITCMIAFPSEDESLNGWSRWSHLILGLENGDISDYILIHANFHTLNGILRDWETGAILLLKKLSKGRILSFGLRKSDDCPRIKIWSLDTRQVEVNFNLMNMSFSVLNSVTELEDNLIAICCVSSEAYDTVHIFDSVTGNCVHSNIMYLHRAHGVHLASVANNFLAILGNCEYFYTYSINRQEVREICKVNHDRSYSTATLPTGEIVVGGHFLKIYTVSSEGELTLKKHLDHGNVIDVIIPIHGYRVLTVDRGAESRGIIRIWDLSKEEDNCMEQAYQDTVASIIQASEDEAICAALPSSNLILFGYKNAVYDCRMEIKKKDQVAEIRKYARLLYQAYEQKEGIGLLVEEILLDIIARAGSMEGFGFKEARKVGALYFCRP